MNLTGEQLEQIEEALLDGYDEAGLERLVRHKLDVRLDRIAGGDNLTEIVHNLVAWAERKGQIGNLIAGAHDQNPQNESLQEVYAASATWQAQDVDSKSLTLSSGWRWFWPLLSLAVLVGAAAAGAIIWWMSQPLCGDNPLCVLVAEFSPAGSDQAEMLAADIRFELLEELEEDEAGEVLVKPAPLVEDRESAKAKAAEEGALLLVWGWLGEAQGQKLRVHFELTDLLGIGESQALRTFRAEPFDYQPVHDEVECTNCLDVSAGELGHRIDIIAHAAAGFLNYAERPEQAYYDFLEALHCAGETVDARVLRRLKPQCEITDQSGEWNPGLLTYYAGKSAALSGDYVAAIDLLNRAAEQNPDDPAALLGIAAAYQSWIGKDDTTEVMDALDEAERRIRALIVLVSVSDDLAILHHNLGLVHELAGDWEAAVDEYGKAANLFGEKPSAYVSLVQQGHAQRLAGDVDGAETTLLHAAELAPDAPWAYLELAELAWHGHEDKGAALGWLEQADEAAPGAVAVLLQRAELCQRWADLACAEEAYQAALAAHQGSGWLHMRVGDFYRPTDPLLSHQSWQRAADQYELAQDYRSRDPLLQERMGYVALNTGNHGAAIEHYMEAIDLTDHDTAPAHLFCNLAVAHKQAGHGAEAAETQAECEQRTASGG